MDMPQRKFYDANGNQVNPETGEQINEESYTDLYAKWVRDKLQTGRKKMGEMGA